MTDFEDGHGSCGEDRTFTTRGPRDHVQGFAQRSQLLFPPFREGISLGASSDPDGSNPAGSGEAFLDDHTAEGPVTCLRVVGDRATVGLQTPEEGALRIYLYDNGTQGDEFHLFPWSGPEAECPEPPTVPPLNRVITDTGDLVFTDVD